jgi:hypothetical protein
VVIGAGEVEEAIADLEQPVQLRFFQRWLVRAQVGVVRFPDVADHRTIDQRLHRCKLAPIRRALLPHGGQESEARLHKDQVLADLVPCRILFVAAQRKQDAEFGRGRGSGVV